MDGRSSFVRRREFAAMRLGAMCLCLVAVTGRGAEDAQVVASRRLEYLHRSRGREYGRSILIREKLSDGRTRYRCDLRGTAYVLTADDKGRPLTYSYKSYRGYAASFVFSDGRIDCTGLQPNQEPEPYVLKPSAGALPEFNSRPDPYLTLHLLLQAYDLQRRGKQTLLLYDLDRKWRGICEYRTTFELVDEDGTRLPNGKFKARHFVQIQQETRNTGYRKWRGSRTDIWASADGTLLRVFRHREPY